MAIDPTEEKEDDEDRDYDYRDVTDEDDLYDWEIEYLLEEKE